MEWFERVLLALIVLCIIEAALEAVVIALKNPQAINYNQLNKKEHQLSGAYWLALCLLLMVVSWKVGEWYYLLPLFMVVRRIFFEYSLKIVRGRRIRDIEGDQFWDRISKSVFTPQGGWFELLALLVIGGILYWLVKK